MNDSKGVRVPSTAADAGPEAVSRRKLALALGGFFLLGLALALLLFGQPLMARFAPEQTVDLPQLPASFGNADLRSLYGEPPAVGDLAYDFTLPDLEGGEVTLSDLNGRPVIINFWATWCAPCRLEMPELQKTFEAYRDQGLVILALNQQEQEQQVREFFDELGLTFTPLMDSDGTVGSAYGALGLPTTYFVNPSGEIAAVHRGILSREQTEDYLAEMLP